MSWDFGQATPSDLSGFVLSWQPTDSSAEEERRELESDERDYTVPVDEGMMYRFAIEAKFDDGSSSSASVNHRFLIPLAPTLEKPTVTKTSITVSWIAPKEGTGTVRRPVNGFELTWVKAETGAKPVRKKFSRTDTSYTIPNLSAGTEYKITLVAHNPFGDGEGDTEDATTLPEDTPTPTPTFTPSPTPTITPTPTPTNTPTPTPTFTPTPTPTYSPTPTITPTPTSTPTPTPPDALKLAIDVVIPQSGTPTDGQLTWELNGIEESSITGFEISWSIKGDQTERSASLPQSARSMVIQGIADNLGKLYNGTVVVRYANSPQTTHDFTLRFDAPAQPLLSVKSKTETTITVKWEFPSKSTILVPVKRYELTWKDEMTDVSKGSETFGQGDTMYPITGLEPSTQYAVTLDAENSLGGNSTTITPITESHPTPTPTATATPSPTPTRYPKREGYGRTGVAEPDPPENFDVVQSRDGIAVFWDNPDYEGVSDVYAYAVDWYPEPPEFPFFLPQTARETRIFGLNPDINYRVRVRAFNRHEDSLPAAQRIEFAHTLFKTRVNDPFTGSITNGRATTLRNETSLPGFAIHADAKTMFWGDHMVIAVRRSSGETIPDDITIPDGLTLASDVFDISAEIESRRKHFDANADSYRFPSPIEICVQPAITSTSSSIPFTDYSIARLDAESEVFDSTPVDDYGTLKICARIPLFDLDQKNSFVVVSRSEPTLAGEDVATSAQQLQPALGIAMMLLLFGPALIFAGVRYFSITDHSRRRIQHRMDRQ